MQISKDKVPVLVFYSLTARSEILQAKAWRVDHGVNTKKATKTEGTDF